MKTTIKTRLGEIFGVQYENHQEFLGIRYAQAPIKELRFKSPVLIDTEQPSFDATQYGPMAYQAHVDDPPIELLESEDCLRLNIYTPKADDRKRPVMVYIHGGGFVIGSASRPRLHGANLATRGDVVVVTIQYRLGVLGFFNHKGVAPNLGLQDQICALRWIKQNIIDYGGDPENVTIFGESAGSMSVGWLMMSPKAKRLFHKAIGQSGAIDFDHMDRELALSRRTTEAFFENLDIPQKDVQTLKQIPVETLIEAERKMTKGAFFTDRNFFPFPDGDIIPLDYKAAWKSGHALKIPLILGMNAEELPLFTAEVFSGRIMQWYVKNKIAKGLMKETQLNKHKFNQLLSVYKRYYKSPKYHKYASFEALLADIAFWVFTTRQAEFHSNLNDVYMYVLNYKAPKINASPHVFDLIFVFGHLTSKDFAQGLWLGGTPAEQKLSHQMMDAWINFARTGNPNHAEIPTWIKYDSKNRNTMIFDVPCKIVENPRENLRIAWENIRK